MVDRHCRISMSRLASLVMGMAMAMFAEIGQAAELHTEIDRQIAAKANGPTAALATDAEFLRRTYLTLAGTIPTSSEARSFLADTSADKRAKLIDQLLSAPTYARRMEEVFSVMLLERRVGPLVPPQEWSEYLRSSFAANKPWDQLVREILGSDGKEPATQGAVKFFADGGRANPEVMTRDVARLFLGMDLQCAQCHDHPVIKDYKQADYFGLQAYLKPTKALAHPKTKVALLAEDPLGMKLEFESVFIPGKQQTGPRLLNGKELAIPQFEKGQEFEVAASDGVPGVPKFRPRSQLATEMTSADNVPFVRNSVNRLWFVMMGRGIVHPLDLDHSENPPSHPELLALLGSEFVAHHFDVKWLLREIALSEAFQRSSQLPQGVTEEGAKPARFQVAIPRPLSPEQWSWGLLQATGNSYLKSEAPKSPFAVADYLTGKQQTPPETVQEAQQLLVAIFGSPPGEPEIEFQPSMGASLFLMNEKLILEMLSSKSGNLVERLAKMSDSKQVADELYLSVLTRGPGSEESAEVASYLEKHASRRTEAMGELAWALITSAEFRLNH